MLWIYAGVDLFHAVRLAKEDLPTDAIDLSKVSVDELSKSVKDYCDHHTHGHIYLGFLDPLLMLHPTVEAQLRRGFEEYDMSVVVSNPRILPLSWKNGTNRLRIVESSSQYVDAAKVINDGGAPHAEPKAEHGRASPQVTTKRDADQSGKEGGAPKRRKQKRQDQAP